MLKRLLPIVAAVTVIIFVGVLFPPKEVKSQEEPALFMDTSPVYNDITISRKTPILTSSVTTTIATTTESTTEQSTESLVPPKYGFCEDEITLLAQLLCGSKDIDGDGEYDVDYQHPDKINYYEVSKVLCVVMNRVRDSRFPSTVTDVVMQRNQFSVMPLNATKTPSERAIRVTRDWCEAYDSYDESAQCVPENHIYFSGNGYTNTTRP